MKRAWSSSDSRARPVALGPIAIATIVLALAAAMPARAQISFKKTILQGTSSTSPTTLQFGPDDRLYVGQQNGTIYAYTIQRNDPNDYQVIATETISLVRNIPNHNDDGSLNTGQVSRQVTGLLVTGAAANPVLYVTSSDPRIGGGGSATDTNLDTNSGVITRLTWNGTSWDMLDLVRGLPRSEENHSTNGMALDEAAGKLYIAQGGNTNMGAQSNNFAFLPEYVLSACVLVLDLNHPKIGAQTYDLPTLDDPSRQNEMRVFNGVLTEVDVDDPFGGNDGANQAIIDPNSPIQVYAPGFRNPYDLVLTADGRLYTIDNGPNSGWGGPPVGCDVATVNENESRSYNDALHYLGNVNSDPPGTYYGGHPDPLRADESNQINGQSPIPPGSGDSRQCIYMRPKGSPNPPAAPNDQEDASLFKWNSSTNGLVEYRASNFSGAMQGNLLAALWNSESIVRIELNAAGDDIATTPTTLFSNVGGSQLDVTAMDDFGPFPGTVWTAGYAASTIYIFEPADFSLCSGTYDNGVDEDGDGYTNADEIDNGTDPCNPGDVPADNDGDGVSDLNDPDDDNDGIPDVTDAFAIDPHNGLTTALPISYGWAVGDPGFGLAGLGFTGLMTNGVTDYLNQFDPNQLTPGGAAGVFTIDQVTAGDAFEAGNDQENAFQFGVAVSTATGPFRVHTGLPAPYFGGQTPVDSQSLGMFIGDGTQDDYLKLVLAADGGSGALELVQEQSGVATTSSFAVPGILSASFIELYLDIDPLAGAAQARYSVDGGAIQALGSPVALGGAVLARVQDAAQALAVGVISTSRGSGTTFAGSWDFLNVTPLTSDAEALVIIGPLTGSMSGASTYNSGSFRITNNSAGGQRISRITYDLSTGMMFDMVFDPDGVAGDMTAKPFTPDSGSVGTVTSTFNDSFHNGADDSEGYDQLQVDFSDFAPGDTFTFSIDVDPTSIKGTTSPGPGEAGSVSGMELSGARVRVEFDDGTTIINDIHRIDGSVTASQNNFRGSSLPAPIISVVGLGGSTPADVVNANQVIHIAGPADAAVKLLRLEGALFEQPGGGYDIDPYETNTAIAVDEISTTLDAGGNADVPVTLTRAGPESGINLIAAVLVDGDRTGEQSDTIILRLVDADLSVSQSALNFGSVVVGNSAGRTLTLSNNTAAAIDITGLDIDAGAPFVLASPPTLPLTIDPGTNTAIDLDFDPTSAGSFAANLTITHTGNNSPVQVALSGSGVNSTGNVLYRINAGGPLVSAIDGGPDWEADNSGGSPVHNNVSNTAGYSVGTTDGTVPPGTPITIFQSERWDPPAAPEMQWALPVPAGLDVEVRVFLANGYPGTSSPGQRIFSIELEGQPFVQSIDLAADVGHQVGTMRSAAVTSDGTIDLLFVHEVENPLVNAIEIVEVPCPDADGDGVCDPNDVCPGGDDNIDLNGNGVPDACECLADINGSGHVDIGDLGQLLSEFGETGMGLAADIDLDGDVDITDLGAVLAAFGSDCP